MNYDHETLREAIGAYVLDQLEGDLLAAVEEHLASCDKCRTEMEELRPLAAPLREVDPGVVSDAAVPVTPPELDLRVRRALAAERQAGGPPAYRRWLTPALAALAGAAVASVAFLVAWPEEEPEPEGPVIETVASIRESRGVDAEAGLIAHTWGMEIDLVASGLREGATYHVVVIDERGRVHSSGGLVGVGAKEAVCKMNSSVLREDAVRFEVRDRRGRVVISARLTPQ